MRIQTAPYLLKNPHDFTNVTAANVKRLSEIQKDHNYNEDWLQDLIHTHPSLLPTQQIKPLYDQLIPVCRELQCNAGYLDNLYVTPNGFLVLAECKLWRNPESRRKVIAQIMDYAKDFAEWDYDGLMQAINKTNKTSHENPLYEAVISETDTIDEIKFVDQVSKNMRLGRHLLLIVGDGIQEDMASLAEHVQKHMGLHFTLGLIEIGLYDFEDKGMMVIPSVVARTTCLDRAIIQIDHTNMSVKVSEPRLIKEKTKPVTRSSLSEEAFFEELTLSSPDGAEWLSHFLPKLENINIHCEMKKSLMLRYTPDEENMFSLGFIRPNGEFHTRNITWKPNDLGMTDIALNFLEELAQVFENTEVRQSGSAQDYMIYVGNRKLHIDDFIDNEEQVIEIISGYIDTLKKHIS